LCRTLEVGGNSGLRTPARTTPCGKQPRVIEALFWQRQPGARELNIRADYGLPQPTAGNLAYNQQGLMMAFLTLRKLMKTL